MLCIQDALLLFTSILCLFFKHRKKERGRRGKNCAEIEKEVIQYKTLNSQLILIRCGKIQEDGHGPYRLPE